MDISARDIRPANAADESDILVLKLRKKTIRAENVGDPKSGSCSEGGNGYCGDRQPERISRCQTLISAGTDAVATLAITIKAGVAILAVTLNLRPPIERGAFVLAYSALERSNRGPKPLIAPAPRTRKRYNLRLLLLSSQARHKKARATTRPGKSD